MFDSPILLIGSGRLARHLVYWRKLNSQTSQVEFQQWNRSEPTSKLMEYLEKKPLIWLAVSDSALIPFYENYLINKDLKVVHFSGALHHPGMLSAHPLMTFTEKLFDDEFYNKIHFSITNCSSLDEALPGFKNSYSIIFAAEKALYHALCVTAGNFPQLLWNEVFKEARNLKIPEAALEVYLNKVTENFIQQKEASLTGPLVRKDHVTVEKNLEALKRNEALQNIYKTFAEEFTK
jgi:predicted short-subunit dehydrogenase-like oxidoreductase (DUF2520 family)